MRIKTPTELGALIRDRRTRLGWDQKSLAAKVGVSRQWIVDVEKGKPRAEIGLLLRTIDTLGLALDAEATETSKRARKPPVAGADTVDIDAIVAAARRKRK